MRQFYWLGFCDIWKGSWIQIERQTGATGRLTSRLVIPTPTAAHFSIFWPVLGNRIGRAKIARRWTHLPAKFDRAKWFTASPDRPKNFIAPPMDRGKFDSNLIQPIISVTVFPCRTLKEETCGLRLTTLPTIGEFLKRFGSHPYKFIFSKRNIKLQKSNC